MKVEQFRQMMDRAQAGEEGAADCLFVHAYKPLRTYATGLMDDVLLKARLEPEDILQDVYAAAWPRLGAAEFDGFPAFLGWLETIAKNRVIDLRRSLLAAKHDVNRQADESAAERWSYGDLVERIASSEPAPSRAAAKHEALAILVAQMWRMPEDYRRVLQWRYIQALPVAEVARRLGRTEPAVHMLCHRALKKLGELMGSPSKYLSSAT